MLELWGLFMVSFLAATLFPAQSEAVLVGLAAKETHSLFCLWGVATFGNTLGSFLNWWLGLAAVHFSDRAWFPVGAQALERAQNWYLRYGRVLLLLTWVPLVGDSFAVAAGVLREKLSIFLFLVCLGKGVRYALILLAFSKWL